MWVCATPATQSAAASRTKRATQCHQCHACASKTTVDVSLCHACHAKCPGVTGDQIRPSAPPSAISATPATQNDGRCEFVPHLPHKTTVDVSLCHACHAQCRGVTGDQIRPSAPPSAISATPATQNDGRCEFVPRPKCREVTGDQIRPSAPPSAISATPATQNDGRCEFVPRLPSKTTVDVSLCHACHAKCPGVTGDQIRPSAPPSAISATPATQNDGRCVTKLCVCESVCEVIVCERWYVTKLCVCVTKLCVWECVWSDSMWEMVCDKVVCVWLWSYCMLSLCVWSDCMWEIVCDKVVYVWVCVKLLYVKFVCMWSYGMWHVWRWRREAGGGGGADPGYRIKNKNPTQSCGEIYVCMYIYLYMYI